MGLRANPDSRERRESLEMLEHKVTPDRLECLDSTACLV